MDQTAGIQITSPKKLWQKDVKLSLKDTLSGIVKSAVDIGSGKYDSAGKSLLDIVFKTELDTELGEKAWVLIVNAMIASLKDLVSEHSHSLNPQNVADNIDAISEAFAEKLGALNYHIDPQFFAQPDAILTATGIVNDIKVWFEKLGYSPVSAQALANRFPAYFPFSLQQEWRSNNSYYQPIFAAFSTPFTTATLQQEKLALYKNHLIKQAHESVFGEPISLKQIYIPLNAYYFTRQEHSDDKKKRVVKLSETLTEWASNDSNSSNNKNMAVRVISGGPGAGKSSFTKIWTAEIVDNVDFPVFYIPLHNFRINDQLIPALESFFNDQLNFAALSPLFSQTAKMLLVFDGLDELSMQGQQAEIVANNFVDEVIRTLDMKNGSGGNIKAIITGRDLSIQNNDSKWRSEGQVLHILPYHVEIHKHQQDDWIDPDKLLNIDLRDKWWQQYGQLKSLTERQLPEPFKQGRLNEISSQPLLNYLLALSYQAKRINFDENTRLDQVYEDLITGVYDRQYDSSTQHKTTQHIKDKDDFIRILEEVALAIWHEGGRRATEAHIAKQIQSAGLNELFDKFQDAAKSGVTRLLMAFYFRKSQEIKQGNSTFEWTHKSFGEYLVARRLIRLLESIEKEMKRNQKSSDSGWSKELALTKMIEIGGVNTIDEYIRAFIRNILKGYKPSVIKHWQKRLASFIEYITAKRLPMENVSIEGDGKFANLCNWSRNCEELIFVLHHSCGELTGVASKISWPKHNSFKDLFLRIDNIDGSIAFNFRQSLGFIDISRQDLSTLNLQLINFTNSILHQADLEFTTCQHTYFTNTKLTQATFFYSSLLHCQFRDANLTKSDFSFSRITDPILSSANLTDCNFQGAITEVRMSDINKAIGLNKVHNVPQSWLDQLELSKPL